MSITYTPNYGFGFNITLGLGQDNKAVNITAEDISDIKTKGIHFELPADTTVELGSLSDLIGWLNQQLKSIGVDVSLPSAASPDWPTVIKNIFDGILNTKVTVTKLCLDQDPQDAEGNYPPIRLILAVTGQAVDPKNPDTPKPIQIIDGLFSVIGGGISLDRNYTKSEESADTNDDQPDKQ
ncbi:hypothetical protein [Paenibacillus xylaniclasticus]|uniref:hypothetical protein n=1 Tax=Paenibacillus xylaniclasticus TaxID=588083 RepID=UPI000FDBA266|nr:MULTISPECIES: hypothetical protein [Paenibacillus]GFN32234.1 hypothetical protein PCURB6_24940 [Paenibacillus curdlanolyticus]